MEYKIKKESSWDSKPYYRISFEDNRLSKVAEVLSDLSTDIALNYEKRIMPIIEFYYSKDKIQYSESKFGGTWKDHPYPDNNIVVWPNMDTTKNNLGTLVTLFSGENVPTIIYSFTYDKIYIGNLSPHYLGNDEPPPILYESTLKDLVELLEWWKDYIKNLERKI